MVNGWIDAVQQLQEALSFVEQVCLPAPPSMTGGPVTHTGWEMASSLSLLLQRILLQLESTASTSYT